MPHRTRLPLVIGSAIAVIAAFFLAPAAHAGTLTPVAYEGFAYTSGQSLVGQNGGTGWNAGWQSVSGSPQRMTVGPTGLTYPGLAVTGNSAGFGTPLSTERIEGNRRVLSQRPTSGVYYVRWLFNSGTTRTSGLGGPTLRFYDGGTQMGGVGVNDGAKNAFIYMAGPPVSTNVNIVDGNTHLLITRFDFDNQRTDLWVDPDLATFDYSLPPTANASVPRALSFDQIHILSLPDQYFDEITVFEWEPICESGVTPDGVRHECFLDGTSTWTAPLGVEDFNFLVVGGGGGGGADNAGGGGAGELMEGSVSGVTPGDVFTVTVGEGGAGGTGIGSASTQGTNGQDSAITNGLTDIVRAKGGGGGGAGDGGKEVGLDGGSGGGGAGEAATASAGGATTKSAGLGNAGGAGAAQADGGGGGGGGATAAGAGGSGTAGGNGGDGKTSSITGTATAFAGGGGGAGDEASDVQGGGGNGGGGAAGNPAVFGTPNTGGGGGGGSYDGTTANGARGGRGIVVISYTLTSHNITYNANGGTGAPAPGSGLSGATVTLSSATPTRDGYTFAGWNTQVDDNGDSYAAGDELTLGTTDVTLYAQWTPIEYTVTYNLNGGTGTAPSSTPVNYAATATVTSDLPSRSGYWFNGWNTAADGSGNAYASGRTFTMLGDVTLYAQWVPEEFELAYNANGGEGAPDPIVTTIGSVNLSAQEPTRTGYDFAAWHDDPDGSGTAYAPESAFNVTGDTVVYADWKANNYTITYDLDGGSGTANPQTGLNYLQEVTVGAAAPTRAEYVFGGWATSSNGTGTVYAPGSTFLMPAEDLTLYAVWIGETVEIHYDLSGGSGGPADTSQVPGSTVVLPSTVPTRSGLIFQGWNTASDGSGTTYAAGASFTMPSSNLTLYAQWGTNPTPTPTPNAESSAAQYTVSIDPNGGICSTTSVRGADTSWVNLPGVDSCTREGYTLRGFATDPNGQGTVFEPGAPIQLTGNNRLFAIWAEIAAAPAPFMCTPDLYQVSGTGGGVIYGYDPTRNTMDLVPPGGGTDRATGANATGYNPADDFIYGIAPNGSNRHLWKFGSNGVYEDLGAIIDSATGAPVQNLSLISGDFIADDLLLAIQRPNRMLTVDVAPTRTGQPAQATLQALPRGVWDAADIAFTSDRTVGYGMSNTNLFIAELPGGSAAAQVSAVGKRGNFSRKTILGVPARGTYGASYLDQDNNAYFYNNEQRRIYLITARELRKTQPRAAALGTEKAFVLGTDQTLQVPTDGASCPTAPIVTVTLEYRINGGSGERPDDQSGFVDQQVTVAPALGFEREGFTFTGWNSAADGSGASFPPGALYSLGQTGGVLFAQWTPEQPAPFVPPEKILDPIEEPAPPAGEGEDVIFTPVEELPAPPEDPWDPSSLVLVEPDTRIETPVVQNQTGDWSVNNRIGTVTYTPEPAYSGPVTMTIQLQTVSGERFQTTLQTTAPTCEVGERVRATVYFDVLESNLTKKSRQRLNRLIRKANREGIPTCAVVVGFVQPTPNRSNDSSLSTSRAESVADYLDDRGITRIIRTEGLGRADQQGAKARRATATIYLAPPPPVVPADE